MAIFQINAGMQECKIIIDGVDLTDSCQAIMVDIQPFSRNVVIKLIAEGVEIQGEGDVVMKLPHGNSYKVKRV